MKETRGDGLVEILTIGIEKAKQILEAGIECAEREQVSGFFVVYSRTGMQECSQAVGSGIPLNQEMALKKIKTVLATRRSNSIQRKFMKYSPDTTETYGDLLGSLSDGGVAAFVDTACTTFVGAVAFDGCESSSFNNDICASAIQKAGLYTDYIKEPIMLD